jgi:hypothetical protein
MSSVARSNWTTNPIGMSTNYPGVTRSNYDIGSRVNVTATVPMRLFRNIRGTASMFYNGQSGRPYSLNFNGDANADSISSNDLMYIPTSSSQVTVYNGTYDQLSSWLSNSGAMAYAGQILPRNSLNARWLNMLDFRYAISIPAFKENKFEVTLDATNFLNLLNRDWGWQYFGSFGGTTQIGYGGLDSAGKMRYNLATITSQTYMGLFTRDDLRSRAQMQIGLRYSF